MTDPTEVQRALRALRDLPHFGEMYLRGEVWTAIVRTEDTPRTYKVSPHGSVDYDRDCYFIEDCYLAAALAAYFGSPSPAP